MEILPVELPLHSTFVDDKVCVVAVDEHIGDMYAGRDLVQE